MKARTMLGIAGAGLVLLAAWGLLRGGADSPGSNWVTPKTDADKERVLNLLAEMRDVNLDQLPALPVKRYELPSASLDVMRLQIEETYEIFGVGKDTVQLTGWGAVIHDNPRPAPGENEVRWGTAISDTEFVGLELHGESEIFGPVHVRLDEDQPSLGQVGKLQQSMLEHVALRIAYLPYAGQVSGAGAETAPIAAKMAAQERPQRPGTGQPSERQKELQLEPKAPQIQLRGEARNVQNVIYGVLKTISDKDAAGMIKFYSRDGQNVFFNSVLPPDSVRGGEEYVSQLAKLFENIRTIRSVPEALQVSVSQDLAVAQVEGYNDVVDLEGRRALGKWRWTVQLEKQGDRWLITHDHLSFVADPNLPRELQSRAAGACRANISAAILMPQLDLEMKTKYPVQWYSEVDTIPPVGYTASVSFTPTPLIADGREVATLTHGVVKFREIVRKVDLAGTPVAASK